MALPKKVKKNINIAPQPIQPEYPFGYDGLTTPIRRKELADFITEDGTFLPKSVLHEDMDGGMLDFVKQELGVTISGKKINIIDRILTLQRWGEFANTWTFANEDRNVELPFIVVVRKPDVQYGSNPSLQYTIPDRKQFHFAKVPTWDGVRKGMDVYTIPQPVPVDITYDVKIISNRMRELNTFNRKVMQKFTSRQAYTFVKGHYIPIVLNGLSDESVIDTEDRRYYQQNYNFQLQGFLIDEEEFEVKPAITRSLLLFDTNTISKRTGKLSNSAIDGNPSNNPNTNNYRRKLDFAAGCTSPCTATVCYPYNASVSLNRMDNVSNVSVTIHPDTQATATAVLDGVYSGTYNGAQASVTFELTTAVFGMYVILTDAVGNTFRFIGRSSALQCGDVDAMLGLPYIRFGVYLNNPELTAQSFACAVNSTNGFDGSIVATVDGETVNLNQATLGAAGVTSITWVDGVGSWADITTGDLPGRFINGQVESVTLNDRGSGYDSNPVVTFTEAPTGGVSPTATALVENEGITSINVTSGGYGYTSVPTILIENGFSYEFPIDIKRNGCYTVSVTPTESSSSSYVVVEDTIFP